MSNHAQEIRKFLKKQPDLAAVDAQEAARALNTSLGLRGSSCIDPQSVIAHKAVLQRRINEGDEGTATAASKEPTTGQERIIKRLLRGKDSAEVQKELKKWGARIGRSGSLDKALQRLQSEATLISSINDSPGAAARLVARVANRQG